MVTLKKLNTMVTLKDYTKFTKIGDAFVQMDKDFDNKLITNDQLMKFNQAVIKYFTK